MDAKVKVRVRFSNGEQADMIVRYGAKIGDRVRTYGNYAVAVVIEVVGVVD